MMSKVKVFLHSKATKFARFVFNKETGEVLGRTWKSWAQIGAFFLVYYSIVGGIFIAHLSVFIGVTPLPAEDVQPWNFGRYAYPNYPNAKIALIPYPRSLSYNGEKASLSKPFQNKISKLLKSANQSGVSSHCLDTETKYGYKVGEPCIFLHILKVFSWVPELINSTLAEAPLLPIACSTDPPVEMGMTAEPAGIPLNLSNTENMRSFPFNRQSGYITPVMGIMLNLTNVTQPPNEVTIKCSLDYSELDMKKPSRKTLDRLYEIPSDATIVIRFKT